MSQGLLFTIAALITPILSSALIYLFLKPKASPPVERQEKFLLALMIAPFAFALTLWAVMPFLNISSPLPDFEFQAFAEGAGEGASDSGSTSQTIDRSFSPLFAIGVIYVLGLIFFLSRIAHALFQLRGLSKSATRNGEINGHIVKITDKAVSPFVNMKQQIIIPNILINTLNKEQLHYILKHEQAHVKRNDALYFTCLSVVEAIFWFHPFIAKQSQKCRQAAEISCDEMALTGAPKATRKEYALTIISVLEHLLPAPATAAAHFFSPNTKGEFQMRIKELMTEKKNLTPKWVKKTALASAALLVPIAALQFTIASAAEKREITAFSVYPTSGEVSSQYGMRKNPLTEKVQKHVGLDIKGPTGTPILAPADGTVFETKTTEGYGNLLTINHGNGLVTRYAQLQEFVVRKGDRVNAGQHIANMGSSGRSTGPHLHFEVIKDGEHVDPELYLPSND